MLPYLLTVLVNVPLCIGYSVVPRRCDNALRAHPSLLTFHPAMLLRLTLLFLLSAPWLFFVFCFVSSTSLHLTTTVYFISHILSQNLHFTLMLPIHSATSGPAYMLLSRACYMQANDAMMLHFLNPTLLPQRAHIFFVLHI